MVYIKKLVMHGFKSFARRTEIIFDRGINVILGPNGSGKSNVSDALCFVLGRLSAKSMRASKAKNLLFMGSKFIKPAKEALVEIVFDNKERSFSIDADEVLIKRAVRRNGQSIYKINNETKTRAEIIEMLAQAGIDSHGFNLVLQGQIQSIVKMRPEDRRKIIEEVAGIALYETRKEKSLHELEKTDQKLKEITSILRERTNFLRNLDREREQALKFKELESTLQRCKASIIQKKLDDKNKELESMLKAIQEKVGMKDKVREKIDRVEKEIEHLSEKVNQINKQIQIATGLEQETLHSHVANLKAELEGLRVRKENFENRRNEVERRIGEMEKSIPAMQTEIDSLKKQSPLAAKKAEELKRKKEELAIIEEQRKKADLTKNELFSIRDRIRDKERLYARATADSESLVKQLEEYASHLSHKTEQLCIKAIENYKNRLKEIKNNVDSTNKREIELSKDISVAEAEIGKRDEVKESVGRLDICPLCQSKITAEHIEHVVSDANEAIEKAAEIIKSAQKEIKNLSEQKNNLISEMKELENNISSSERELERHHLLKEKQNILKQRVEEEKILREELKTLDEKRRGLESKNIDSTALDEKYDNIMLEIEEISARSLENVNDTVLFKERDLEKIRFAIQRGKKDLEEVEGQIGDLSESLEYKTKELEKKEGQEKELNEKFKKLFEERDNTQKQMQDKNLSMSETRDELRQIDDQVNFLNVGKARIEAERDARQMEMTEFAGVELIKASMAVLEERLNRTQESLKVIGSINMRALEVYEDVKKEYDSVQDKVNTLQKEREEIMKIIEEIDKKKIRSFMKTFKSMNDLFTQNFSQLYTKGIAFLELENKEDVFAGGVNIVVKLAKGKYFDVTSLSGGEQTLVALSLLFAIQEYKPYHFYILDEIDAALDKRNSERLSGLLTRYMKSGQYIVITHNDAVIMNSNVLYGVSMHEGVSKILSLDLNSAIPKELKEEKKDETAAPIEETPEIKEEDWATAPEEDDEEETEEDKANKNILYEDDEDDSSKTSE